MSYKMPRLEEIYDKIDAENSAPMCHEDQCLWGLDYLKDVQKQLERLEKKALEQNNPILYRNVRLSMQRSDEVIAELKGKIKHLQK